MDGTVGSNAALVHRQRVGQSKRGSTYSVIGVVMTELLRKRNDEAIGVLGRRPMLAGSFGVGNSDLRERGLPPPRFA